MMKTLMTTHFKQKEMRTGANRGFTLIEIIIALMIFSIVAVVALAALVKIIDANKKAQTVQDAVVGLSFAMEAMSRELRTATNIRCESGSVGTLSNPTTFAAQQCPASDANFVAFDSATMDNTSVPPCHLVYAYLFVNNGDGTYTMKKAEQPASGNHCADALTSDMYSPIVPTGVTLTGFQLGSSASTFPIFFIRLSGYAGVREQVKTYFNIQTAASQRNL